MQPARVFQANGSGGRKANGSERPHAARHALATVVMLCAAAAAGCGTTTTTAKLHDPARVALSFERVGRPTVHPIDEGEADKTIGLSVVGYEGQIVRADKGLEIKCSECKAGDLTVLTPEGHTAPSIDSVEEIVPPEGGKQVVMHFKHPVTDGEHLYPMLKTERANVAYFQQTREPERMLGWALAPGAALTIAGVIVLTQSVAPGAMLLGAGLVLDGVGVYHLLAAERVERYDAHGRPLKAGANPKPPPAEADPAPPESDVGLDESLDPETGLGEPPDSDPE